MASLVNLDCACNLTLKKETDIILFADGYRALSLTEGGARRVHTLEICSRSAKHQRLEVEGMSWQAGFVDSLAASWGLHGRRVPLVAGSNRCRVEVGGVHSRYIWGFYVLC